MCSADELHCNTALASESKPAEQPGTERACKGREDATLKVKVKIY